MFRSRPFGVAALVALFGVVMAAFLSYFKFEAALEAALRSRMTVPAVAVREAVEATLALGVPLAGASETPALLEREGATDPEIDSIEVADAQGRRVFAAPVATTGLQPGELGAVRMPLRNSFDLRMGEVVVRYPLFSLSQRLAEMRMRLALIALVGWAVATLLAAAGLAWVARREGAWSAAQREGRLTAVILAALMLGLLAMGAATQRAFEAGLRPELERKAGVVGASVGELVGKALDHGLALDELVGVSAHFDALRAEHRELAYLVLRDAAGAVRFASGAAEPGRGVEVPIERDGRRVGSVEAQVGAAYIRHILLESALDLGVVFVVALFLTRELLHGLTSAGAGAAQGGAAVLARLRAPLFLFMLAEELTRAFLPGYARSLVPAGAATSPELLVGLPIVVFMAVVAFGQPLLAPWSERGGHRRTMAWGAAFGVIGLAGAALATGLADFVAWRALCGLGYGMVFVAGQGLVIEHTGPAERTRGFAMFVGAIMVAGVCGPPVGGMLADHLGPRWGFGVAAALAAAAALAVSGLPGRAADAAPIASGAPTPRDFARLFREGRFLWVTLLAALPAKLILAGACFYLVPVYAGAAGAPPSVAGRALMLYAVLLVLVLPQATRWVERGVPLARLVGAGLALSSLGGFALLAWHGVAPLYAVTALLGLGQGLSIAAQSSLLAQVCGTEIATHGSGPVFGAYRLIERLGNTCGPLLAGALVLAVGHAGAFVALAALTLASGLLFALLGRGRFGAAGARA
ncbi:MAG: MFS transporter [Pelomonas sp.]|nr:MFS transporter [Roseateles sp.]